jgi:hypothetical protein
MPCSAARGNIARCKPSCVQPSRVRHLQCGCASDLFQQEHCRAGQSMSCYQHDLTYDQTTTSSTVRVSFRGVWFECAPGGLPVCLAQCLCSWLRCLTNILLLIALSYSCSLAVQWRCTDTLTLVVASGRVATVSFARACTGCLCMLAVGVEYLCLYVAFAVGLYMYLPSHCQAKAVVRVRVQAWAVAALLLLHMPAIFPVWPPTVGDALLSALADMLCSPGACCLWVCGMGVLVGGGRRGWEV